MFLTCIVTLLFPPWWKQSFHPCFECALHSKSDIIIAHILTVRASFLIHAYQNPGERQRMWDVIVRYRTTLYLLAVAYCYV